MKLLALPHKKASYRCPVNGLCDIYQWQTGKRIPEQLLFDSRIGCKIISTPGEKPATKVFFGEGGIGHSEYTFWSDKIGYRIIGGEDMPFQDTVQKLRELIDREIPVLLFGLDMFHLPYHKSFYHKIHVPGHVNLMVGYDEETIYVHDNDRDGVQQVSHADLRRGWAAGYMGFSKKNAFFGIDMTDCNPDIREILRSGLSETANAFLNPPAEFLGEQGYTTLMRQLDAWSGQATAGDIEESCMHLVTFTASTIPEPPKKLLRYHSGVPNPHQACRDIFSAALRQYSDVYGGNEWMKSSVCLAKSGELFERVTDHIADIMISGNYSGLRTCIPVFEEIRSLECEAFQLLL